MSKLPKNPVIELIKKEIPKEVFEKFNISPESIYHDLRGTQTRFELANLSLVEIFQQEKKFYIAYGMSAFDAGYLEGASDA